MRRNVPTEALSAFFPFTSSFLQADKTGFYLFCAAVVLGLLFGALQWFGLTLESGLIAALASSGLYQVAAKVGGR